MALLFLVLPVLQNRAVTAIFNRMLNLNGYINANRTTLPAMLKHGECVAVTFVVQNTAQVAVFCNPGRCSENTQCMNGLPMCTLLMNPVSCSKNKTHQKNRKKKVNKGSSGIKEQC